MEISTKELRIKPGRIIEKVSHGQEVVVTFRGKALARIVPMSNHNKSINEEEKEELFGLWKDHEDIENVDNYVRKMRKGREF